MTKENHRKCSMFGTMSAFRQWANEWNTVGASLKCSSKDLSKIKIVCEEDKNGRDEKN